MSIPLARSRYKGEFVVKDTTNNRQYLADLIWSWSKGDGLTGWTLGGTTLPTIAADGQIDLYDATAGGGTSFLNVTIPNTNGNLWGVLRVKMTRQVDDTSLSNTAATSQIYSTGGTGEVAAYISHTTNQIRKYWKAGTVGYDVVGPAGLVPQSGVEAEISVILSPKGPVWLFNNVLLGTVPLGMSQPLRSALQLWCDGNKKVQFYVEHTSGQVSHYRVHDIKVGRLVGVGDV